MQRTHRLLKGLHYPVLRTIRGFKSSKMPEYCYFDYERPTDLFNALDGLRLEVSIPSLEQRSDHLKPLIDASNNSTGRIGRLSQQDIERMQELGRCTHSRLLVLLLEPTVRSDATIEWVDSFLQSAACGSLNRSNTAIINCRSLIPNASYLPRYEDKSE